MIPQSGVFTTPSSGYYAFFLSFCTTDTPATVGLLINGKTFRLFNVPLATTNTYNYRISRNTYTVISELLTGDKVNVELKRGSIIELSANRGVNSEACTRFSGFLIR